MIINPSTFDSSMTANEVYQLVNTLPIGYSTLAQQMHYWGRLFGVITGEVNEQDWDEFVVNQCLRDSIWSTLRTVAEEAENFLGYDVSRRYHNVITGFVDFNTNVRVRPGIEKVDYAPTFTSIPDTETVSISPFLIENITAVADGQRYYILVSDAIVDNPNDIIIRRSTDYGVYTPDASRRPTKVGNNWKIYIDNQPTPYNGTDLLVIQSVKYVYVDITPPTVVDGELVPVFYGTNQIIPQAKPPQTLVSGKTRYWFYIWTMVDPAFYNRPVDLVAAEFYKLVPFISFSKYSEEKIYGELTITGDCCADCGGNESKFRVSTSIVDARRGVVSFKIDGQLFDDDGDGVYERLDSSCTDCTSRMLCPNLQYELRFSYITNPIYLDESLRMAISQINQAILYRVAADLPMVDCGCWLNPTGEKLGFIARQQEVFGSTSTNSFTGTTSVTFHYGDLRGQKAYAERMSKVPRIKYVFL